MASVYSTTFGRPAFTVNSFIGFIGSIGFVGSIDSVGFMRRTLTTPPSKVPANNSHPIQERLMVEG